MKAQTAVNFKTLLQAIEKKFEVRFSYTNKAIEHLQIDEEINVDNFESITTFIDYLNDGTFLKVTQINERYISIALKNNLIRVCGYLIDEQGNPLADANIVVYGKNQGTVSDGFGYFELVNLEISDLIEIHHLSVENLIKGVNSFYRKDQTCATINLFEQGILLDNVFLENYILKSLDKNNDGSISMNTTKFGVLGGQVEPDLLQTSQILPGIEAQDESIANLNVRNGASDQNTIYWDNIKMYHSSHFFGLISAINPFLTEKISVIKSGASAKHNDGVSSSFFLETEKEVKEKMSVGAGINLVAADVFIKAPISEKIQLNASYRKSINDFVRTPTYQAYFEKTFQNNDIGRNADNTNFSFFDVNLNTLVQLNPKNSFQLNYILINNLLVNQEIENSSLADNIDQKSRAVGLIYKHKASENFEFSIDAYNTIYNLESDNYQNKQQQLIIQENEVNENALKANVNYKWNDMHSVEFGYQLTESGVLSRSNIDDPFFLRIQKGVVLNNAIFGEYTYSSSKITTRLGMRFNHFDKINTHTIEPRLNVKIQLSDQLDFLGNYEQKSQYTSQVIDFLDDFLGIENRRWVIIDDTIPLIQSEQVSAGFVWKKNKFLFDVQGYYKQTNGILISGQGFQNQIPDRRLSGNQEAYGAEVLMNQRFHNMNLWSSYTFAKSNLHFNQIQATPFPASNDIRHSVTAGINLALNKQFNFSLVANLKSGKPYTTPVEGNETTQKGNFTIVNYNALNTQRLNSYNRLDFSASYAKKFNNGMTLDFKAGILNILNNQQTLNRYYIVDENDENKAVEININSLKITPNLTARITF